MFGWLAGFETGSYCSTGLPWKPTVLPQLPQHWSFRCESRRPARLVKCFLVLVALLLVFLQKKDETSLGAEHFRGVALHIRRVYEALRLTEVGVAGTKQQDTWLSGSCIQKEV